MHQSKTTIAPDVLLTIARLTTLNIPGVSRLCTNPPGVNRLIKKPNTYEGIHVDVKDDIVFVKIHVILQKDVNLREVSRNIQQQVSRAISEMVGMQVGGVNVHIEDIDYTAVSEA